MENEINACDDVKLLIDTPEHGNSPRYKNDLNALRLFISKLDVNGYEKNKKFLKSI